MAKSCRLKLGNSTMNYPSMWFKGTSFLTDTEKYGLWSRITRCRKFWQSWLRTVFWHEDSLLPSSDICSNIYNATCDYRGWKGKEVKLCASVSNLFCEFQKATWARCTILNIVWESLVAQPYGIRDRRFHDCFIRFCRRHLLPSRGSEKNKIYGNISYVRNFFFDQYDVSSIQEIGCISNMFQSPGPEMNVREG